LLPIATLKNDAYRAAFVDENPTLAEQLCIRANAAACGQDMEVVKLLRKLWQSKTESTQSTVEPHSRETNARPISVPPPPVEPIYKREDTRLSPPTDTSIPLIKEEGDRSTSPDTSLNTESAQPEEVDHPTFDSTTPSISERREWLSVPLAEVIPWAWLILDLVAHGLTGFLLTWQSSPPKTWTLTVILDVFGAWIWAFAGAEIIDNVGNRVRTGTLVLAGIKAIEKLLQSFSKFHTFMILSTTSALGLGLGWLVHWVFSSL
jgi:hypothetical protein